MPFLVLFWLGCALALLLKLFWPRRPVVKPPVALAEPPPTYVEVNPVTHARGSRFVFIEEDKP